MSGPLTLDAMDVVILCGGRGTRLGTLTATTPKPLLPIGGIPFLLHHLLALHQQGSARFLLAAHYLADQVRTFAARYAEQVPGMIVIEEPSPLGTGGALRHAAQQVSSPLFVAMNGDSWVDQPLAPVVAAHQAGGCALTMVLVCADRLEGGARPRGIVSVDAQERLTAFRTTETPVQGWVNAGVYVLDTAMVRGWPGGAYSFEERVMTLIPPGAGRAFCSDHRLLDIGTPACYEVAKERAGLSGAYCA